jgi:glyoxylate/hydroxypyruvate reductase
MHGNIIPISVARNLNQLVRKSDVVIVGCALMPDMKHLINADFMNKSKSTSVFKNIARGPFIDTNELVEALNQSRIFGPDLDIIEDEPNNTTDRPTLKQSCCVVLPHMSSAIIEIQEQVAAESAQKLLAGLTGEALVNELKL